MREELTVLILLYLLCLHHGQFNETVVMIASREGHLGVVQLLVGRDIGLDVVTQVRREV